VDIYRSQSTDGSSSVFLLNTEETFSSIIEASRKYTVNESDIVQCCKGRLKSAGKLNGKKLVWKYY
jgi:hypothetical protein